MSFSVSLQGQTALITGAATGIGRATALLFAQAGARVVVNHRGQDAEAASLVQAIEAAGGQAIAISADVSDASAVQRLVDDAIAACGDLHILVNNAGIIQEKAFLDTTEADWDRMLGTDLKSVFLMCRAVLPGMVARGSGAIVNIASDLGILGRERYAPYCTAKAGVIGLTRSLAREFAPHQIRVNAIAPGGVDTAIWESGEDFQRSVAAIGREATLKAMAKTTPLGRFASSEEMADSILYLLSDAASNITGHVMVSDGGFTL